MAYGESLYLLEIADEEDLEGLFEMVKQFGNKYKTVKPNTKFHPQYWKGICVVATLL